MGIGKNHSLNYKAQTATLDHTVLPNKNKCALP